MATLTAMRATIAAARDAGLDIEQVDPRNFIIRIAGRTYDVQGYRLDTKKRPGQWIVYAVEAWGRKMAMVEASFDEAVRAVREFG